VYDWLGQRLGYDSVFMDVAAIPFAVNFPDFIKQAIANSRVLIALIGGHWLTKIHDADDPVRMEIETAIANHVPVLPVLIGNTPMPNVEDLPPSISTISILNATTVGVLHDFNTHMQMLLPKLESILGALAATSVMRADSRLIERACAGIISYLSAMAYQERELDQYYSIRWEVVGTDWFSTHDDSAVTLFLHRIARLAELIELHFILSVWMRDPHLQQAMAGWVMSQLEQTPIIPDEYFESGAMTAEYDLKIRWSDEDPRQVWKMITDDRLRLSLAYVATVSPQRRA
jgi:hypothetical protein